MVAQQRLHFTYFMGSEERSEGCLLEARCVCVCVCFGGIWLVKCENYTVELIVFLWRYQNQTIV